MKDTHGGPRHLAPGSERTSRGAWGLEGERACCRINTQKALPQGLTSTPHWCQDRAGQAFCTAPNWQWGLAEAHGNSQRERHLLSPSPVAARASGHLIHLPQSGTSLSTSPGRPRMVMGIGLGNYHHPPTGDPRVISNAHPPPTSRTPASTACPPLGKLP